MFKKPAPPLFQGGTGDGAWPAGGFTISDNILYGVTIGGGAGAYPQCYGGYGCGTIYSIAETGSFSRMRYAKRVDR